MRDFLENATYFGVVLSLIGYELGLWLKKKTNWSIFNPLLVAILFTMAWVGGMKLDVKAVQNGAAPLNYLLTPATICLAVPLYRQIELLKKYKLAITLGILSGVLASLGSVLGLSVLFGLTHEQYVTLLPKSITTAIGMGVSEENGGIVTITVAVIIITGVLGNIMAELICRLFRITEPVAKGIGIGSAAHAVGTAKAIEMGEIEGAMSSLSIVVAGLVTVIGVAVFANFW